MIRETNEEYHANAAISHSKLETFRRRPALYHRKYVLKTITAEAPSTAFRIGSAAHTLVLERDKFGSRYAIKPETIDRRTKDGKAAWAEFEAANVGKTIIEKDEVEQLNQMADAVWANPLAEQLFAAGHAELSWRTSGSMPLQCRTDWFSSEGCALSNGRPYIVDLKTVESLNVGDYGSFERSVFNFGYHRQAGFYLPLVSELLGRAVYDFFFVAVEKVEPFGVAVYRLSDEAVTLGQDETIKDLRWLKGCMAENEWPNIEPEIRHLGVPSWYKIGGAA